VRQGPIAYQAGGSGPRRIRALGRAISVTIIRGIDVSNDQGVHDTSASDIERDQRVLDTLSSIKSRVE